MNTRQVNSNEAYQLRRLVRHSMGKAYTDVTGQECFDWLLVEANRNAYLLNRQGYCLGKGIVFTAGQDPALNILEGTYNTPAPKVKLPAKTEKPKASKKIGRPKGSKNKPKGEAISLKDLPTATILALAEAGHITFKQ